MNETIFYARLVALPNASHYVRYKEAKYLLTKETLLDGKLIKVYAQALGHIDVVSGNYYPSIKNGLLKPCEMSDQKVIDFIVNAVLI